MKVKGLQNGRNWRQIWTHTGLPLFAVGKSCNIRQYKMVVDVNRNEEQFVKYVIGKF